MIETFGFCGFNFDQFLNIHPKFQFHLFVGNLWNVFDEVRIFLSMTDLVLSRLKIK